MIQYEELEKKLQSTIRDLEISKEELKTAKNEFNFSNTVFNNFLTTLNSGLLILDKNLNILKYTDGIRKFFTIPKNDISNFTSVFMNSNVSLPTLLEDIKKSLINGQHIGHDIEYMNKNYSFSINRINIPINHLNNIDFGIVISFVDKTEMIKKDQILFQQSKMTSVGEMIGNIAHQWRQPLNTISILNMHIALKYEENILQDKDIQDFKTKSSKLVKKMSDTIDDFRNFFRPNTVKEKFDVKKAVLETFTFIEDTYKESKIEIQNNITENLYITGFKNELIQVLLNILNNSKDAIKLNNIKNGNVILNVEDYEDYILLILIDNGGGIKKEMLHKIFEPYFTTKFDSNGTGLGLYMAKVITEESMFGTLEVKNYQDGIKTMISLPKNI